MYLKLLGLSYIYLDECLSEATNTLENDKVE